MWIVCFSIVGILRAMVVDCFGVVPLLPLPPPPRTAATTKTKTTRRTTIFTSLPQSNQIIQRMHHHHHHRIASSPSCCCLYMKNSDKKDDNNDDSEDEDDNVVDVAIIGAGLGGLCAGAILNTLYNKRVAIYESHYIPGGCAHAFSRTSPITGQTFVLDSGPTILLGCSSSPSSSSKSSKKIIPNPLQQVLQAIKRDQDVTWIPYNGWGMIENPPQQPLSSSSSSLDSSSSNSNRNKLLRWKVELGPNQFQQGPLRQFGGPKAQEEYQQLQEVTKPLLVGVEIPAMAMRSGPTALIPLLLRHFSTLIQLIQQQLQQEQLQQQSSSTTKTTTTATFAPYMDGPLFTVTDPWLRNWLDALAFSLSGLPASRTAAAAMAFTLYDMHKGSSSSRSTNNNNNTNNTKSNHIQHVTTTAAAAACLDYPAGGLGSIVDALVRGVEQEPQQQQGGGGGSGGSSSSKRRRSKVHLRQHVERIEFTSNGKRATGLVLANGQRIVAKDGVICNAPVASLRNLVQHHEPAMKILGQDPNLGTTTTTTHERRRTSWTLLSSSLTKKSTKTTTTTTTIAGTRSRQQQQLPTATIRTIRPTSWDNNNTITNNQNNDTGNSQDDSTIPTTNNENHPSLLDCCDLAEQTGSFLHLHLALNATGLDLTQLEAHYTVMDRGLSGGDGWVVDDDNVIEDGPCGELNMIAVSNPCVIDPTLAPPGTIVMHAYGAANEPYQLWQGMNRNSQEYKDLKQHRAQVLWRAVESIIPDVKDRILLELIGSPLTHERYLRRPQGTYGSATEDYLKDGATPIDNLILAGDGIFPGIGLPAVTISGASAANSLVNPWEHWQCLRRLDEQQQRQ